MTTPRFGCIGGVIDNRLYVVGGGISPCDRTGVLERFDPATNMWTSHAPMPTARSGFDAGVVNGVLYAVGGLTTCAAPSLALVEAYDSNTNTWTTTASMPTARHSLRVGVVNGILYAVGGIQGFTAVQDKNEAYDPTTGGWSTRTPMPTPRYEPATATVDGILYVIGGLGTTVPISAVEAYDPATDSWSTKSPMPIIQASTHAAVVDGIIYLVAGNQYPAGTLTSLVQAYDPALDTWTSISSLPTPRSDLAVEAIDDVLYAVGGFNFVTGYAGSNVVEAFEPSSTIAVGWTSLGFALPGAAGAPLLVGTGSLTPGSGGSLVLSNAAHAARAQLFGSLTGAWAPFMGGTLVPNPTPWSPLQITSGAGVITNLFHWPSGIPSGTLFYFQYAILDSGAVHGVALSNALRAKTP